MRKFHQLTKYKVTLFLKLLTPKTKSNEHKENMQHNFSKAAQKSIELFKMWIMKTFGTYDGSVVAFNT